MLIMQLSDTHLRGDGELSYNVVDTVQCLDVAAQYLKTLQIKPDAVVITGDLANSGDELAYNMLYEALSPLNWSVYVLPGNHDRRDRMRNNLGNWCPVEEKTTPEFSYTVDLGQACLIMLDTMKPSSHSGHFRPNTAKWLEKTLNELDEKPTLLFTHHPPFITGMGAMDEPFENVAEFESIMLKHSHVRLCCGHMHRPIFTTWAGCLTMTAPAISMQIDLDLSTQGGDTFKMETPGYLLHHLCDGRWNSHVCQIPCTPSFSGPHPFVGSVNPSED